MKTWYAQIVLVGIIVVGGLAVVPFVGRAATLNIAPSSGTYLVGQAVTVTLRVNTAGQSINASEATLTWTPETLQFVSVSAAGSIFKYWPVDPVVRGSSTIIYSGGLANPGYTGGAGTILRVSLRAKAVGKGTVTISGGKVLANDGQGTDLYTGAGSATYSITAASTPTTAPTTPSVPNRPTPVVSSPTFPDQSAWYRDAVATLNWTKPAGALGFNWELTASPATVPSETVALTTTTTTQTLAGDGTWYFHLRAKYADGWSSTAHYSLHLDRTPPESFTPTVEQDRGSSDPSPMIVFSTTDKNSGVSGYTYSVDGGEAQDAVSPVDMSGVAPGQHTVTISAHDAAGNVREAQVSLTVTGYPAPVITSVSSPLLLLDPLVVRGTANAGDTVTVYVNGQEAGKVVAGTADRNQQTDGITVHLPWVLTSDFLFRPGLYHITATATAPDGQTSVATDSRDVRVVGHSVMINGRPIATYSIATPIAVLALSILVLIFAVMAKLGLSVWLMHRHEHEVEEEIDVLRDLNRNQGLSRQQIESALAQLENDLERPVQPVRKRSSRKRGR